MSSLVRGNPHAECVRVALRISCGSSSAVFQLCHLGATEAKSFAAAASQISFEISEQLWEKKLDKNGGRRIDSSGGDERARPSVFRPRDVDESAGGVAIVRALPLKGGARAHRGSGGGDRRVDRTWLTAPSSCLHCGKTIHCGAERPPIDIQIKCRL